MAPVWTVTQAAEYAAAGARLVDVGDRDALVPAIREQLGDLRICGYGAAADIVRDADLAARTGAGLICPDVRAAARAGQLGIAAERVLVQTGPAGIAAAAQAGWAVLVDLADGDAGLADGDAGLTNGDAGLTGEDTRERAAAARGAAARKAAARKGTSHEAAAREAAVAAVCAWLGASVIRTRHVTEIRRSVEMTESILGRRPPAGTLRGLA
jgi:hypothetical protein